MNTWKLITAALLAIPLSGIVQNANAEDKVKLGNLECNVDGGSGFIFGSTKDLSCTFTPLSGEEANADHYVGVINKYGIDIGETKESYITWLVIAPVTADYSKGALAGSYVGATANASVGVGLGANVLVGGSASSFTLQPLSLGTQAGVNVAAGLAEIELLAVDDSEQGQENEDTQ